MLREIRIRDASRIYRVMYVAKVEEAICVLHCFQKKTQVPKTLDSNTHESKGPRPKSETCGSMRSLRSSPWALPLKSQ
jgi:hypothetical protein